VARVRLDTWRAAQKVTFEQIIAIAHTLHPQGPSFLSMPMHGQQEKPMATRTLANVHGLKGTSRRDRIAAPALELPPASPKCRAWLSPKGRKKWRHICRAMSGQLADIDQGLLLQYCQLWQKLVQTSKGELLDGFSAAEHSVMLRIGAELGIGARSRAKVAQPTQPPTAGEWSGLEADMPSSRHSLPAAGLSSLPLHNFRGGCRVPRLNASGLASGNPDLSEYPFGARYAPA